MNPGMVVVVRWPHRGLRRLVDELVMVPAGAGAGDGPVELGTDLSAAPPAVGAGTGLGGPVPTGDPVPPPAGPSREHRGGGAEAPDSTGLGAASATGAESERIEALVTLAQGGDVDAFGMLYEHYVASVYWYVFGRVGQQALAEDITAETFLRALRRLDSFSWQGKDIAAWFVTIARNLITDHHRSSRYRLEVTTDDLLLLDRHGSGVGGGDAPVTPEDHVLRGGRDRQLLDAVRSLRPDQQECIVLRFFHDFTIAQTALAMGRTEGAVKQLQLRAVRALARTVERPT
jgi:RNA polymerase sigma-70 factor (ECF subfamily)